MTINAQPHRNGNTPGTFMAEGRKIASIANNALHDLNMPEALNGRNYQHLSADLADVARAADVARWRAAIASLQDLRDIGLDLFGNGERGDG